MTKSTTSRLLTSWILFPVQVRPTSVVMEGIVGAGVTITPQVLERLRPS
jgi:type III restriction enzyme